MLSSSRREFLRGSLIALGLMMVPAAAIMRPRGPALETVVHWGGDLLEGPAFDLQALIEHDAAEAFVRMESRAFLEGVTVSPGENGGVTVAADPVVIILEPHAETIKINFNPRR